MMIGSTKSRRRDAPAFELCNYGGDLLEEPKGKLWTKNFLDLGGNSFFQFILQYAMLAALPIYIVRDLGGTNVDIGMAMTCFQIGTVVCRPMAGRIIDSSHKKHMLLIIGAIYVVVIGLFNIANYISMIYVLRAVQGVIFALGTTLAATLVTLILPEGRKGEGIGYFAMFTSLAMVVGPLLGLTMIQSFSSAGLFIAFSIVSLGILFTAYYPKLPDKYVLPQPKTAEEIRRSNFTLSRYVEKKSVPMAGMAGIVYFAYAGILIFMPVHMNALGLGHLAGAFFAVFAGAIIMSRPFVGRVFDSIGEAAVIYPGFIFFVAGMFLLSIVNSGPAMLGVAALTGIGFGALGPAFQTVAVRSAPAERAGVATATYFWSLDISVGIASVILSFIATHYGYAFMYLIGSIVSAAGIVVYFLINRSRQQSLVEE